MPNPKKPAPAQAFNPYLWEACSGSSEFEAMREHVFNVWDSNEGVPDEQRAEYVKGSLIELKEWIDAALKRNLKVARQCGSCGHALEESQEGEICGWCSIHQEVTL